MNNFDILEQIVINRRSTKPAAFNGKPVPDAQVRQLLELANWAPTHGLTEPWRFIVYSDQAVRQFCHRNAEQYRQTTQTPNPTQDKFVPAKYEKQLHNGDLASHLILAYMKRGPNAKITAQEELSAASAAVENLLLGATALGIAAFWSTGGSILHPVMKASLALQPDDAVLGLIYLGYTDESQKPGTRTPVSAKTIWFTDL